jgi:hypothetical protein
VPVERHYETRSIIAALAVLLALLYIGSRILMAVWDQ